MKVTEAFSDDKPTLSFEFFPPKTPEQEKHLFEVIAQIKALNPDFVSITYGAMGTTRDKTFYWAKEIKHRFGLEPLAHLTCVAASRDDIAAQLDELEKIGVENILALRGDPPAGTDKFVPPAHGFKYAKELIAFIKKTKPAFCLGAAGFPEKRGAQEIEFLKEKVGAGAEYVITQLFFDNRYFFDFVERCRQAGITVPILPGLMPITSTHQIKRMTEVCGATIPEQLLKKLERYGADPAAIAEIGIEQAMDQSEELIAAGVKGIHFFVLNQAGPVTRILRELKFPGASES